MEHSDIAQARAALLDAAASLDVALAFLAEKGDTPTPGEGAARSEGRVIPAWVRPMVMWR